MDKMLDRVSFWRHPIAFLYQLFLILLIGGRPVVVNVTIDIGERGGPASPLMYWPRYGKRPMVYNVNLYPTETKQRPQHNALITSNPE